MMNDTMQKAKKPDARVRPRSPFFELIQNAYETFNVQQPHDDCVCSCCMEPDIKADFLNHPARDLPDRYIRSWYSAAVDTNNNGELFVSPNLWKHLLPRIMEAFLAGADISLVGTEVIFQRFPAGDKSRWSDTEWAIIDQFQKQCFQHFDLLNVGFFDDLLCMFVLGGWDGDALIAQVKHWPIEKIVTEVSKNWDIRRGMTVWTTAFWDDLTIPNKLYTDRSLIERITAFGCAPETPRELADRALRTADALMAYRR